MGNHEYHDPRCWRYFEMPIPVFGRPSERAFYSFTWGDAAFIVLDFNGGWYRIIDIDDMPSGTYVISDSVVLQLTDTLLHEKSTTLKQLRDRPFTRQAISAELVQRGFSEAESRAVRTVALAGLRDFPTYEIAIRNPKNGRISFSIPANRELFQGQWVWMLHELRRHQDKKYIFVFGHHPIRYGGRTRQPVVDLCERFGVSATFSGHRHVYGHHLHKNVHFFQAGGHSDTVFSSLADGPKETFVFHRYGPHYIVITVEEDQATVLSVGRDNQVFESTTIQPRRK